MSQCISRAGAPERPSAAYCPRQLAALPVQGGVAEHHELCSQQPQRQLRHGNTARCRSSILAYFGVGRQSVHRAATPWTASQQGHQQKPDVRMSQCLAIAEGPGLVQGSGAPGPLLQNINLQMARDEYELNGQQGLDQLLSVLGGEEVQVALNSQSIAHP